MFGGTSGEFLQFEEGLDGFAEAQPEFRAADANGIIKREF